MAVPSSAKLLAPVHPNIPARSHTTKLAPTLSVLATTTPGDELKFPSVYEVERDAFVLTKFPSQSTLTFRGVLSK